MAILRTLLSALVDKLGAETLGELEHRAELDSLIARMRTATGGELADVIIRFGVLQHEQGYRRGHMDRTRSLASWLEAELAKALAAGDRV